MAYLCKEICDDDRFACPGHPKQNTVLRRISQAGSDADQITSCTIVYRFGAVQMSCERRRPWYHVCQIGIFGSQIKGAVGPERPTWPCLEEELPRVFRYGRVMDHRAPH